MLNSITNLIGYSGADNFVLYICAAGCVALTICLAHRFLDFILDLVSAFIGRGRNIKF